MAETTRVRVTDGDVWVDGEHYSRGDEVDVPSTVYDRIPASFERLDEAAATADTESADVGEWDETEWLDGDYQDRADLVRTGAVDAHLDAIEDVETSDTVLGAVEARREELEG